MAEKKILRVPAVRLITKVKYSVLWSRYFLIIKHLKMSTLILPRKSFIFNKMCKLTPLIHQSMSKTYCSLFLFVRIQLTLFYTWVNLFFPLKYISFQFSSWWALSNTKYYSNFLSANVDKNMSGRGISFYCFLVNPSTTKT